VIAPRQALFDPDEPAGQSLPVCDHYAGVESLMRKSLALQAELGPVFDVTLDGEDGAPVGGEIDQARLITEMVMSDANRHDRVGARVVPVANPKFEEMLDTLVQGAGRRIAYVMCPKPRGLADVQRAADALDRATQRAGVARTIPLHALVETHGALREVMAIAGHPRIESVSFGLMDFVSAHRGALPLWAMSVEGQFEHPLVVRAKLEISAACHASGKTPSHCVVTEFQDTDALTQAARKAARLFGYTRMWSIHPAQVRPIVAAFSPTAAEVDQAVEILWVAQAADWAPIRHRDTLQDRASYRYFWQLLERAHRTSRLPADIQQRWFAEPIADGVPSPS
jgi:citrate lyase subunit beta/citryl-CoA lyase